MERYEEIDVPEFMKVKRQPIKTVEEQEKEVELAFIKGGITGIIVLLALIVIFIIIALIEMI